MRHPTLADGDRRQPPMPTVLDSAGRARQRVLALFLPAAAALYISAEALNPHGTDQPISTRAVALKELPIAVHHPSQLYVSGSLTLLALGALAVSYAAIATLVRNRGSAVATVAALTGGIGAFCGALVNVLVGYNLAAAATAHMSPGRVGAVPGHHLRLPGLPGVRCRLHHRHLRRAGAYGVCPVAEPERAALAGGPVLRRPGTRPAAGVNRPGPCRRAHAAVCGGHGPAGRLDLAGSRAAGQPHPGACRHTCEQPVKTSRPQPQASAALLEDLLMARYRGATRLGAQLHNLPHGTVWWPASGVPGLRSSRPGTNRPRGITARPQPASGK
jgi:hypothetical protein